MIKIFNKIFPQINLESIFDELKINYREHSLLWILISVVTSFLAWSFVFHLDVASYAQGVVIPAGQLKRIQHLEGGIIKNILVVEGQKVQAGQAIAEIENVASDSDVGDLNNKSAALEIKLLRIKALLANDKRLVIPDSLLKYRSSDAREAQSAFSSAKERIFAMNSSYAAKIAQRNAEIRELQERQIGLNSRSKYIFEQVKISEKMLMQKLTHEYEHLQLKKEQAQIDAEKNSTIASEQRAKTALAEAQAALAVFKSEEDVALRKELQETMTEYNSVAERLRKPNDSLDRTSVKSPVTGNILTMFYKNKGAVVPPGGTLATLVPDGESLLIEAKLPISDIGYVSIDAPARLSLMSGASGFSPIKAKVAHISPDAIVDEKTGASYYLIRLKPSELIFVSGNQSYPLKPGVQITSTILTGERSVISLLAEPFGMGGVQPLTER